MEEKKGEERKGKRERKRERETIGRNNEFAVGETRSARRGVLIRVIECARIKVSSATSVFFVTQRVNVEIARLFASRFAKLSTVSFLSPSFCFFFFFSLAFFLFASRSGAVASRKYHEILISAAYREDQRQSVHAELHVYLGVFVLRYSNL